MYFSNWQNIFQNYIFQNIFQNIFQQKIENFKEYNTWSVQIGPKGGNIILGWFTSL